MLGPQFEQLRMLMTAKELHDMHSIDVQQTPESRFGGAFKSMDAMWKAKKRENKADGFDKLIAAEGVKDPVSLTTGRGIEGRVIEDGHHRIQAAYDANPESFVPVEHFDRDQSWPARKRS